MLKKLTQRLRSQERYAGAAFVASLPEFLAAFGAIIAVLRLLPMSDGDKVNAVLRMIVVPLAVIFWVTRFIDHYGEVKKR